MSLKDETDRSVAPRPLRSFCRMCNMSCPILVTVVDGRAVEVLGDRESPVSEGYTCVKGRAQPELLRHPHRLLRTLKRVGDELVPVPFEQALDEIAAKVAAIVDRDSPRAVASYVGTFCTANMPTMGMAMAFMTAIGSPMDFTPIPIDKPGKEISRALHGLWGAPGQGFDDPDVCLLIGANPFVSYTGFPYGHPPRWLSRRQDAGMKLIVIDPRRSDVARRADLHMQPRPGEDIAILAAMVRIILRDGLADEPFLEGHVSGVDALRRAVEPFDSEVVARRADIDANDLVTAARWWAGRRGFAFAGTGPSMSASSTLLEYLVLVLTTITGKWLRQGERVRNPRTLMPALRPKAQALGPTPAYGLGEPARVRGLRRSAAGMPTAALPDEILVPGPGRVRALISCAGNPVAAFPNQLKTIEAMRDLELLVQIDPWMSQTARLAHYVIAPRMALESVGATLMHEYGAVTGFAGPVDAAAMYSPALVHEPPDAELVDEWEVYYGLARRLGLQLNFGGGLLAGASSTLDMEQKPTTDDLLDMMCSGSRIPLDRVRRSGRCELYPDPPVFVGPSDPGWDRRLDVGNADMMADLAQVTTRRASPDPQDGSLRLVCRRLTNVRNSSMNLEPTNHGRGYNPAFMHPSDLARLGVAEGDTVTISTEHGTILGIAAADANIRPGLLSMAHAFGDVPERDFEYRTIGSNTSRLLVDDRDFERYSGQPRMSGILVRVERVASDPTDPVT
jgi:anaerobic selenocysteine-containing dehydrogenase